MQASANIFVWNYKTNNKGEYYACISSSPEYPDGDFTKDGTILGMFVTEANGEKIVDIVLHGDYDIHDLDDQHNQVVVEIGGKTQRWRVKLTEYNGNKFCRLRFVNSARLIKYLVNADWFSITLPLYKQGATTFYFNCNNYPLEWE